MLHLAAVDEERSIIYVEYPECVIKYHLGMYEASIHNSKYAEEAELEQINDKSIPEIILEYNKVESR